MHKKWLQERFATQKRTSRYTGSKKSKAAQNGQQVMTVVAGVLQSFRLIVGSM